MRASLLMAACLAMVAAVPTAAASPARLAIEIPEGAIPASANVPVSVTLELREFSCHEPRDLTVHLWANASAGVKATFANTTLVIHVEPHSYFGETFVATHTVDLRVRAIQEGDVELAASFSEPDVGPCSAPGGFQEAHVSLLRRVDAPRPGEPPAEDDETPPMPTTPTKRAGGSGVPCGPEGGCGPIGDYNAAIGDAAKDVPSPSLLLAGAAVGAAALLLRRKP